MTKVALILGVVCGLPIFVSSCGSGSNVKIAEQGVDRFHLQLDSEQYQALYVAGDDGLHKATTQAEFVALLQAVHQKLGKIKNTQRRSYQTSWSTGQGTVMTLVYDTHFDGGVGTEQFVWRILDNQPALLGYHINSKTLILK